MPAEGRARTPFVVLTWSHRRSRPRIRFSVVSSNVGKLALDEFDCLVSGTAVHDDDIQIEIP